MALNTTEVRFLTAHNAEVDALAEQCALTKKSMIADAAAFRRRFGDFGRAALELARARVKLPGWFADSESAQQLTHPLVAAERARFFAASGITRVRDVTCSIGGEASASLAAGLGYIGSDIDAARVLMATLNAPGGRLLRADALRPATRYTPGEVILADPARRRGGTRITDPAQLLPPPSAIMDTYPGAAMAIKCAPGIDYTGWPGLVRVVSVAGGVKETGLYSPHFGHDRQAVVLDARGRADLIDSTAPDEVRVAPAGRFIINPDGAVVRAGLVAHYAVREGLWMLDERIAFLTGDRVPSGASGFEILEQVSLKRLRKTLELHDAGALEILVRGVDVDPDRLRKQLHVRGNRAMTVVITRIGRSATAFVCTGRVH